MTGSGDNNSPTDAATTTNPRTATTTKGDL